jgi:hypothetical protein
MRSTRRTCLVGRRDQHVDGAHHGEGTSYRMFPAEPSPSTQATLIVLGSAGTAALPARLQT